GRATTPSRCSTRRHDDGGCLGAAASIRLFGRTMHLVVNGKFTAQRLTGVQRVACELMRAVGCADSAADEIELAVPNNAVESAAPLDRLRRVPWLKGDLWEQ